MQKIIFSTESFVNTMLHTYSQTEKQTENMEKWQANRQIDRKIEIHTNVQTYHYQMFEVFTSFCRESRF